MADTQFNAELVIKLANIQKVVNELKRGLGQVKLPELNFSQRDGQNLIAFIRALSQSGPQVRNASANLDHFNGVLSNTARILNSAAPGLRAYSAAQRVATAATTRSAQAQARQVSVMEDLGRQTAITVRRFSGFLIARDLIFGVGFAFRSSIADAIKFEREISKIAQLQNTSFESARQLGKFISGLANQFGASATELAKASQILAQAGKNTGEIQTILKSLGQASLTPTFGDLTKTTDSLLAVLGQFELKAKDTAQVLDILNGVSKEFNVSVDELFEGVRRAGSTFSALSGVKEGVKPGIDSLKEFVALFTSVIDTSRESAETIGTAFRTILPRLLRGNTRDLLKKELGLDLLDNKNQFIGPFKAIEGLVKSINSLGLKGRDSSLTKIAEELGGSREFNRILPLLLEFPKAQRALELANKSGGSVARDTEIAFQTLAVQLQKVREELQEIGRDLVSSGTFKAFADAFLITARAAATLARALEPLIPLIATLATAKAAVGLGQFTKGILFDNAFKLGPVRRAGGGEGAVSSLLTPGELVIGPQAARVNGQSALRRFNATGDISALKTLKGISMVPGTGNTDSVHANLEPGSFVIKKSSVQKALGFKKFAQGGEVKYASGGPTFGLNPNLGGLDPATTAKLVRFGGELSLLGESTKSINRLFKALLSSSRDLPTALARIEAEVNRAKLGGYSFTADPRLRGGGSSAGNLSLAQPPYLSGATVLALQSRNFTLNGGPRGPIYSRVSSQPQLALPGPTPITDPGFLLPYDPSVNGVSNRASTEAVLNAVRQQQLLLTHDPTITPHGVIPLSGPTTSPIKDLERALRDAPVVGSTASTSTFIPPSRSFSQDASIALSSLGINTNSPGFRKFGRRIANPRRTLNAVGRLGISSLRRNFNPSTLAFGATLAGGATISSANSSDVAGFGGALSGAGVGALLGSTFGPIGTAAGALAGALTGAVLAVKNFNKELETTQTNKVVSSFLAGRGSVSAVAGRISGLAGNFQNTPLTFGGDILATTRNLNNAQRGAFGRASFLTRLGARASLDPRSFDRVANNQLQAETDQFQAQFEPAVQNLTSTLIEKLQKDLGRGKNITAQQFAQSLSPEELKVLAVGNASFKVSDLNDPEALRQKGIGAAIKFAQQTIEASGSAAKLGRALSALAVNTTSLTQLFDQVDARLREFDVTFSNFDNKVAAITNPGQVTSNNRFNVFSNLSGISTNRVNTELQTLINNFGLKDGNADTTARSVVLSSSLQTTLPGILAQEAATNPTAQLQDVLNRVIDIQDPKLKNLVSANIGTLFGGDKETTLAQVDNFEQVGQQLAKTLDPAVKIFEKIFNLQEESARKIAGIVNERTSILGGIADQTLSINGLRNRRQDVTSQILGLPGPTIGDVNRRVRTDVRALTGGPVSVNAILSQITELQKGGITADEAAPFNNLVKSLQLLSNDTRVLDATLEKNNQLQQAAQGARSVFERALSGPDEINKINQELRDLTTIANGGQVSGPRALAALRTGQQFAAGLTNDQFQQQTGISKEQFAQNLDKILGAQGSAFFGKNDAGFAASLRQNLLPSKDLANTAGIALDVQTQAAEALKSLDEKRVQDLNALIQEQSVTVAAAVKDAFNSEQVQNLTTAMTSLKDAQLTVTGKTEVVVSFNNANGVFKDIQDDLKDFIGGVVNEQIKSALQNRVAGANTA